VTTKKSTKITTENLNRSNDEPNEMQREQRLQRMVQSIREMEKRLITWVPIGKEPLTMEEFALFQNELTGSVNLNETEVTTEWT
jgi:hypothetical protein